MREILTMFGWLLLTFSIGCWGVGFWLAWRRRTRVQAPVDRPNRPTALDDEEAFVHCDDLSAPQAVGTGPAIPGLRDVGPFEVTGVFDSDARMMMPVSAAPREMVVYFDELTLLGVDLWHTRWHGSVLPEWRGPSDVDLKMAGPARIERAEWWRRLLYWLIAWPLLQAQGLWQRFYNTRGQDE